MQCDFGERPIEIDRYATDRLYVGHWRKEDRMIRGIIVSLALAAGLSISSHSGNAHATVVAPSLAQGVMHSLVEKAGVDYCYWKPKKNGSWKLKCED